MVGISISLRAATFSSHLVPQERQLTAPKLVLCGENEKHSWLSTRYKFPQISIRIETDSLLLISPESPYLQISLEVPADWKHVIPYSSLEGSAKGGLESGGKDNTKQTNELLLRAL